MPRYRMERKKLEINSLMSSFWKLSDMDMKIIVVNMFQSIDKKDGNFYQRKGIIKRIKWQL